MVKKNDRKNLTNYSKSSVIMTNTMKDENNTSVNTWEDIPVYYEPYTTIFFVPLQENLPDPTYVMELIEYILDTERENNIRYQRKGSKIKIFGENGEDCIIRMYRALSNGQLRGLIEFQRRGIDTIIPFCSFYGKMVKQLMNTYFGQFAKIGRSDKIERVCEHKKEPLTFLVSKPFPLMSMADFKSDKKLPAITVGNGHLSIPKKVLANSDTSTCSLKAPMPSPTSSDYTNPLLDEFQNLAFDRDMYNILSKMISLGPMQLTRDSLGILCSLVEDNLQNFPSDTAGELVLLLETQLGDMKPFVQSSLSRIILALCSSDIFLEEIKRSGLPNLIGHIVENTTVTYKTEVFLERFQKILEILQG